MIRFNPSQIKSITKSLVCSCAILALTSQASAQSAADLPRSTVEAISIGDSQRTLINDFLQVWSPRVLSDKPQDVKRAMEALTQPLQGRGVSVAFRQAYTQAITPLMNDLENQGSVGSSLSMLRLAGKLATPAGAARIKSALNSDDLGIQIFAVSQAGQIFLSTSEQNPAITGNDSSSLINAISTLASDQDIHPELLSACVRALSVATMLPSDKMGDSRSQAIVALADAVGPRLRSLTTHDDPSFAHSLALEAASAATASIADISSQANTDATKAAVGLGGDIVSVSLRRMLGKTLEPVSSRAQSVRAVQAGETLLYFALRKDAELRGQSTNSVRQTNFAEQLAAGDDQDFRNSASRLLGPGSPIVKGFGFQDDRFLR